MNDKAQNLGKCFETLVGRTTSCNLWSSSNQRDIAVLHELMNQVRPIDAASILKHVYGQRKILQHLLQLCMREGMSALQQTSRLCAVAMHVQLHRLTLQS